MHIEPGVVMGAKLGLGFITAAGAIGYTAKLAFNCVKKDGLSALAVRSIITTALVFSLFQILPHYPAGVSEVHFILGSTLFLIFGAGAAAIGLAMGLLAQGLFFAPSDLAQYGMNVTSLLVPLLAVSAVARKIIPANTAYKDISYKQALALSTAYQAGVVGWVGFWSFYGSGFGAETITAVATFSAAYSTVIIVEPLLDLALLAAAKASYDIIKDSNILNSRLCSSAA